MNALPATLRYSLAILMLVILLALGWRLGAQWGALGAARSDLADAERNADDLRTSAQSAQLGPPLLDAKAGRPEEQVKQLLASLGVKVGDAKVTAVSAAPARLTILKLAVDGRADAAALDRVALWAQANARSVILQRLSAVARADGGSDVRIELDVLVHGMSAPTP